MGRRWGKSTVGEAVGLSTAAAGGHVAWCVPHYKNGAALWRACESVVAPISKYVNIRRTERTISFPNGGFLGLYSMDNENSIRNEAFNLVIMDEAAMCPESAWLEAIYPTLADTDGDAILISTPKGKNYFFHLFMQGKADMRTYASFRAPSTANPLPGIRRAVDLMRARYGESFPAFRQEWLAHFLEDGGEVFHYVTRQATAVRQSVGYKSHVYVMGIDWGYHNDYTVITVIDVTTSELVYMERFTQVDYTVQIGRVAALYERFRPAIIIPEQNNAITLCEMLLESGAPARPFVTGNASKAIIIQGLAIALERNTLRILNHPTLISELESFGGKLTPTGVMRYSAPPGLHDDCVMSLALANFAAQNSFVSLMFA